MGVRIRNINVGDNLSSKTLNFNFSISYPVMASYFTEEDIIYVNENNKIYSQIKKVGIVPERREYLYLKISGVDYEIGYFGLGSTKGQSIYSYTLPSNFGTVQSINTTNYFQKDIEEGITVEMPSEIKLNNNNVSNIYFNGTKINQIYFNEERIF